MIQSTRHAAATDIGLARETNEDSYLANPPLYAVADGMGGHMAGDVASRVALEALARHSEVSPDQLVSAVRQANHEVHQEAASHPELRGMGTTITAMVVGPQSAEIAHVGDSRAYLLRQGSLTRLTTDHTVVERMVREGRIDPEDADHHPQRSYLERALGVEPTVEVDSYQVPLQPGDRILLCTDGLTTMLDEESIREILTVEPNPDAASHRLVAAAIEAGGSDNVTVVVIEYPGTGSEDGRAAASSPEGSPSKRRRWIVRVIPIAVAVVVAVLVLRGVALSRWFVGEDRGQVTIFRGVPGVLQQVEERTDVSTAHLPDNYRIQLEQGMRAADREEADEIVANLREIQQTHSDESPYSPVGAS